MRLAYALVIIGTGLLVIGFGLLVVFKTPLFFGRNPALSAQTADQNDGYVEGMSRAMAREEVPPSGNQEARK